MGELIAVADAGPLIHLSEIKRLDALAIFNKIFVPPEVNREVRRLSKGIPLLRLQKLGIKEKNLAAWIAVRYELDIGEAEAITLCKTKKIKLLLTDDLDARIAAESEGLEAHGSIGILLRAFREGFLTHNQTIKSLQNLESESSLFITHSLIQQAIKAVKKYRKEK
ncbi:MAG: hypothetical protein FE048_01815 [Thermoplasmata archaeon]|nr:MAG: hypothetical protein FE048_01815 [Thermoplasmata archaeon]